MKDIEQKIMMRCPLCGNNQFSFATKTTGDLSAMPDDTKVRCSDCGSIFSKTEIFAGNMEAFDIAIDGLGADLLGAIEEELKRTVSKWNG